MTCHAARGTVRPLTAYRVIFARGTWARIEVTACGTTPQEAQEAAWTALRGAAGVENDLEHVETVAVTS